MIELKLNAPLGMKHNADGKIFIDDSLAKEIHNTLSLTSSFPEYSALTFSRVLGWENYGTRYATSFTIEIDYDTIVMYEGDSLSTSYSASINHMDFKEKFRDNRQYIVRLYDGFDREWIDVSKPVSKTEAQVIWDEKTNNGKKNTSYSDIDYYKISAV